MKRGSPVQWRDGSSPQSHCVPGTAERARAEEPSAWPAAGWRSTLQPETNTEDQGRWEERRPDFTWTPVTWDSVASTNQGGVFLSVQSGSSDGRKSQPLAWSQGHTVAPGRSLQGARGGGGGKVMWPRHRQSTKTLFLYFLESVLSRICTEAERFTLNKNINPTVLFLFPFVQVSMEIKIWRMNLS